MQGGDEDEPEVAADGPVQSRLAGGLLTLRLNRPERHNALDDAVKEGLAAGIGRAAADGTVRAVLLCGAGPSFCAGGDVRRIDSATPAGGTRPGAQRAERMLGAARALMLPLLLLDKPVVAAVHGHVMGAGVGLALAADVVVAADDVRFAFPFVAYALPPDLLTGYLLPRWVGPARARDLLLRPRPVAAEEALRLGLVSQVTARAELDGIATAVAGELACGPTLAFARTKRQVNAALGLGRDRRAELEAFAELEARDHGDCVDSADYAEAVRARREQRAPTFEGA